MAYDPRHILRRLEENSDRFAKTLDYALDRSSLNGSRSEDEINGYVHDFEEATDRLKNHFESRGYAPDSTREVLVRAGTIDCFMARNRVGLRAKGDWQVVRSDLRAWARFNGMNGIGGCSDRADRASVARTANRRVKTTRARVARSGCNCPRR
jgi:hypothetical protein